MTRWTRRTALAGAVALASVFALTPVGAQRLEQTVLTDSLRHAVRQAGRQDASARHISGRVALALLGGIPVGFFVIPAVLGSPPSMIGVGAGVAVIGGAGAYNGAPQRAPSWVRDLGQETAAVYDSAFQKRWSQRRRNAALGGGVVGVAAGVGFLVWLVSQLSFSD